MLKTIEYVKSAHNFDQVLPADIKEAIMLGRSNVGKSSFINSLFNRKNIAKTGGTPGKTKSINYYCVDNSFYMVDMPGYGYAKISKTERDNLRNLIYGYITGDRNIALAFHLIDCRHKPTDFDIEFNDILRETGIPYVVVLSKTDKLNQAEVSAALKNIKSFFPELITNENLIAYSAFGNRGHREILARLKSMFA